MAYKDGNKVTVGTGTWYTRLTVTADEGTASTTFTCTLQVYSNYGLSVNYNTASIKAGSSSGGSQYGSWVDDDNSISVDYAGGNSPVTIKTWTVTVAKGSAAKTVYFTGSYYLCAVLAGTSTASLTMTVPALVADAPTACTNTRNSDSKNTVSWTRGVNADAAYASQKIERSIDGGAWSEIASVSASATSYADSTTSANHSYAYRVRAYNSTGYTAYATSETTYNTPASPSSVQAARTGEAAVLVTVANPANTATALELQRSADGASWATVKTVDGTVTELTDEPGGGTFYYRARNTRGELASDWSPTSNAVVTICAPNAPTVNSPASGVAVNKADGFVLVAWTHNPIDGSAQTEAEIEYDWGEGVITVNVTGSSQEYELYDDIPLNSTLTVKVRTKGAHEDFSPWSAIRSVSVKMAPTVFFQEPSDGFSLGWMPLAVSLSYSDESGSLAACTLTVQRNGSTVYTRQMGTDTEALVEASEWLPENHETYVLRADVRSSSTLTSYAVREITVEFAPPMLGTVEIETDADTGYANLLLGVVQDDALAEVTSLDLWRVADGSEVPLASGLMPGAAYVDKYAPLNADYFYKVASSAETGAYSTNLVEARVSTPWAYVYYPDGIVRGMFNPSDEYEVEPSFKLVHYAGRKHPVAYMRDNLTERHTVSVTLMTREEALAFRKMAESCEPVVAKLFRGDVFHAVAIPKFSPKSGQSAYWGEVSVELRRIDGDDL